MGLRTQPCGLPMFAVMMAEVLIPIMTDSGLPSNVFILIENVLTILGLDTPVKEVQMPWNKLRFCGSNIIPHKKIFSTSLMPGL